jgi:hypothetical protein
VADPSSAGSGWTLRPVPPEPRSIVEAIREGTIDAELAATVWLLVEARVPLVVAAVGDGSARATFFGSLLDFIPPGVRRMALVGSDEEFEWLPQASELGWPGTARPLGGTPVRPDSTVLVAAELSGDLPSNIWGERARVAVRATAIGYGLATTMEADSLDDIFDALGRPPISLTPDELSYLGCAVILRRVEGGRLRVAVAHYIRPTVRDAHGHTQRLGPTVLATWDPARDAFEHFGWGIMPELAFRIGKRSGDVELEIERRRELLAALAAAGITQVEGVRDAIGRYLATSAVVPRSGTTPN